MKEFNNPDTGIDFEFLEEDQVTSPAKADKTNKAEDIISFEEQEADQENQELTEKAGKTEELEESEESEESNQLDSTAEKTTGVDFEEKVEEESESVPAQDNVYLKTINSLADKGWIKDAQFEGFDPDADPTEETLVRLLEHNFALRDEANIEEFYQRLDPLTQRIISLDLNTGDSEVLNSFLRTLGQENEIKSLNPENEFDQEQIIRIFYKGETSGGKALWSDEEVENRIKDLRESGLIEREAKSLKPKLDLKAEQIAREKEETQKSLKEIENRRKAAYYERVGEALSKGKIGGIAVDGQTAKEIFSTLVTEDVPVRLPEGKEIRMPYLEALIFHHKFNQSGDVETLALAAYLLKNPKKFKEEFTKLTSTEMTNEFIKQQKYSSQIKVAGDQKQKAKNKEHISWNSVIKR